MWVVRNDLRRLLVFSWGVSRTEPGSEPDTSRKPEIVWQDLVNQRVDMTEVNKR